MNKLEVSGFVLNIPNIKVTQSGIVAKFIIAIDGKDNYLPIVALEDVGVFVDKNINKGDGVKIIGTIQRRKSKAENNGKYDTFAFANEIELTYKKEKDKYDWIQKG